MKSPFLNEKDLILFLYFDFTIFMIIIAYFAVLLLLQMR